MSRAFMPLVRGAWRELAFAVEGNAAAAALALHVALYVHESEQPTFPKAYLAKLSPFDRRSVSRAKDVLVRCGVLEEGPGTYTFTRCGVFDLRPASVPRRSKPRTTLCPTSLPLASEMSDTAPKDSAGLPTPIKKERNKERERAAREALPPHVSLPVGPEPTRVHQPVADPTADPTIPLEPLVTEFPEGWKPPKELRDSVMAEWGLTDDELREAWVSFRYRTFRAPATLARHFRRQVSYWATDKGRSPRLMAVGST